MNLRRSSTFTAGLLAGLFAVAACGGTAGAPASGGASSPEPAATTAPTEPATAAPTETAATTPTAGRTGRIEIADEQVAITLPDDWVEVVLSGDDIEGLLGNFPEGTFSDEQLAMMKAAVGTGMKLMAFDTDGQGSNVNLLVQPTEIPLDLLASALEGQLAAIPGAAGIKITEVEVDGEDALLATYDLDQAMANGAQVKMAGTQLYVSANGRLYVFTVSLADGSTVDPADILDTVELLD
jgi:hypothetical protein